jgi:hypothetical protein
MPIVGPPGLGDPDRSPQRWCCDVSWVGDDPCWWCGREGTRWQDLPADRRPLPWATSFTARFDVADESSAVLRPRWDQPTGRAAFQAPGVPGSAASNR